MNFTNKVLSLDKYARISLHILFAYLVFGYSFGNLYSVKSFDYISYLFMSSEFCRGNWDVIFNTTWSPLSVLVISVINLISDNLFYAQAIFTIGVYLGYYYRIIYKGIVLKNGPVWGVIYGAVGVILVFSFIHFFADPLFIWILSEILLVYSKNQGKFQLNWGIWILWLLLTLTKGMGLYLALLFLFVDFCRYVLFNFRTFRIQYSELRSMAIYFFPAFVFITLVFGFFSFSARVNHLPFNLGLSGKFNMSLIQDVNEPSKVHFNIEDNWKLISKNYLSKMGSSHPHFQEVKYGNWYWLDPGKADYVDGIKTDVGLSFLVKYTVANLYIIAKELSVYLFLLIVLFFYSLKRRNFPWIFSIAASFICYLMFAISHIENRYIIITLLFFWFALNLMEMKLDFIRSNFLKFIVIFSFFSFYIDGTNVLKGWNLKFQIHNQPSYQAQIISPGVYDYTDDIRTPMVLLKNPRVVLNRTVNLGYIDSVKLKIIKPVKPILIIEDNHFQVLN